VKNSSLSTIRSNPFGLNNILLIELRSGIFSNNFLVLLVPLIIIRLE